MAPKSLGLTLAFAAALLAPAPMTSAAKADDVAYLSGGQLVVYGSAQDDFILATEDLTMGTVTVAIYGLPSFQLQLQRTFPRAQVARLYLNPLEGDDWAVNQTTLPSSMEGWCGDDVLWGGPAGDDLWGDSSAYPWLTGDDYIDGGAGNDTIQGGPGDDTLYGEAGYDLMHGGDGDDLMHGGDDADELFGDGGANVLWGDAGLDGVFCFSKDTVHTHLFYSSEYSGYFYSDFIFEFDGTGFPVIVEDPLG